MLIRTVGGASGRPNHDMLVDAGDWYVLVVLNQETEAVLRMGLTSAATVDEIIDGNWWDAGDGGHGHDWFRQFPWTTVFDSLEEPRGGSA